MNLKYGDRVNVNLICTPEKGTIIGIEENEIRKFLIRFDDVLYSTTYYREDEIELIKEDK